MADFFTFTIHNIDCTIEVLPRAYSHVLKITAPDIEVYFEHDESGEYRMFKMPWQDEAVLKKIDATFIREVVTVLNSLNN